MTERKGLLNSLIVENFSLLLTDNFGIGRFSGWSGRAAAVEKALATLHRRAASP
jgi:hypothetical protein